MACNHKYNRSEGCSICATKNSTSQFRPWYDHYPEECYCRVFRLENLDGRRGYVCNPCVLYIKRAIQSLDNPSKEQLQNPPDHTKRLDCKQKGGTRPVIMDIWPPDGVGAAHQAMPLKERGFYARHMKFRPLYVFTGRPFVKLKSTYQLIPAGRWRDPRDFLEQEDNAEKDLKYYRRVTLRKGAKTLKEKEEEKRRAEALENAKLFGKVTDKSLQLGRNFITNKKEHKQNTRYSTRSKGRKSIPHAANQSERKRAAQTGLCGTRAKGKHAAVEECFVDGKEDLWKDVQYFSTQVEESDDEGTNEEEDDLAFGEAEKSSSASIDDIDESTSSSSAAEVKHNTQDVPGKVAFDTKAVTSGRKRRNSWTEDTETIQRKHLYMQNNDSAGDEDEKMEEEGKDHHSDSQEPKLCSLQAKKKNRRTIQEPVKNLKPRNVSFMDCSYWQKFRLCCVDLYMGEGRNAVIRPRAKKWRCPVMLKHMERLRQRRRRLQTRAAAAAAEEEEAALKVVEETGVAKEIEASSSLSSGDDELNDNRNNFTSSPLVEASLMVEAFHFFGAQHSKESKPSSTS